MSVLGSERYRLAMALVERSRRREIPRLASLARNDGGGQARNDEGEHPEPIEGCSGREMGLLTWTIVRRARLKPGVSFDLVRHPYLVALYGERAREVVVYKAGQMGASEYAISYALHAADERAATVLYVFPTDTHVSDFSAARIGPAIEASAYLDSIVVEGGAAGGRRGADRVTLKRVRDRFVYLRGAKVSRDGKAAQLKAVDADVLVLDEVDEMDSRAPTIAEKRLGHSEIGETRWVSTPSYPGVGIHAKWQESDQREWMVRCEHCGEWQPLTIQQVVTEWDALERPVAWNGMGIPRQARDDGSPPGRGLGAGGAYPSTGSGCLGRAFAACRRCGGELDRLGAGEWVAAWPGREVVGYHLTRLFSPVVRLIDVVQAFNTTDETERREAFNQILGEPYVPRGGQISDEVLDACRREYAHGPVPDEVTVMGMDVGRVLHATVRGPMDPETGERPQRWAGEIESWEGVGYQMRRFSVGALVIDALPETSKARDLQAEFPRGRVWLAYYVTQKVGSKRAEPVQWNEDEGTVNLDRTRTLDQTLGRFYSQENTLPGDARGIVDYYAHLKASVRALEDGPGGQKVARYTGTGPDHLMHAENYCTVASLAPAVWDGLGWA